ncbi:MAG: Uncharacterised protein [Flavobacteriia bacterium]|nr:MAG: Uncharacterised protein [Flavobacteriia bacterium]
MDKGCKIQSRLKNLLADGQAFLFALCLQQQAQIQHAVRQDHVVHRALFIVRSV